MTTLQCSSAWVEQSREDPGVRALSRHGIAATDFGISKRLLDDFKVPTFQESDWESAAEFSRLDLQTLPRSRGRELTEFKSFGQRGLHLCISGPYAYNNLKPILANTFLIQGLSMRKLLIRSIQSPQASGPATSPPPWRDDPILPHVRARRPAPGYKNHAASYVWGLGFRVLGSSGRIQ